VEHGRRTGGPDDGASVGWSTAAGPAVQSEAALKVRDLVRLLAADGWRRVKTRGSHRKCVHQRKPGHLIVPERPADDIAVGTLLSILKKAGLR
jgi:predicted RNA binding protein YcfA (HicA-like mRNA interferase family)